jgi:hypothetical protein
MEPAQSELLLLLLPVVALDGVMRVVAGVQLYRAEAATVRGGNKAVWAVVIAIVNFGWVGWFLAGRKEA